MQRETAAWAGIDAGKPHHHVVVVDGEGKLLLFQRVLNDEAALTAVIEAALLRADRVTWAIDLADGPAAMAIAVLLERRQELFSSLGLPSIGTLPPIAVKARATPETPQSSPIKFGRGAIAANCGGRRRLYSSCGR